MAHIARELRGWPLFVGLQILSERGLLWYGDVWDHGRNWPAWLIVDATRRNAQARRMDGKPWTGIGDAKAKSLPGSDPSWPIGVDTVSSCPLVLLCEGQPDFCAAPLVAWWEEMKVGSIGFICMTGAGASMHPDALPLLSGRRIRIMVHDDMAGRTAALRWARELLTAGAVHVDGFDFSGLQGSDGKPIKDLADFAATLDAETSSPTCILADVMSIHRPQDVPALLTTEASSPLTQQNPSIP